MRTEIKKKYAPGLSSEHFVRAKSGAIGAGLRIKVRHAQRQDDGSVKIAYAKKLNSQFLDTEDTRAHRL